MSITDLAKHVGAYSCNLVKSSSIVKHILSHQIIYAKFWWVKLDNIPGLNDSNYIITPWNKLGDYGMPQLIVKYLENEE